MSCCCRSKSGKRNNIRRLHSFCSTFSSGQPTTSAAVDPWTMEGRKPPHLFPFLVALIALRSDRITRPVKRPNVTSKRKANELNVLLFSYYKASRFQKKKKRGTKVSSVQSSGTDLLSTVPKQLQTLAVCKKITPYVQMTWRRQSMNVKSPLSQSGHLCTLQGSTNCMQTTVIC